MKRVVAVAYVRDSLGNRFLAAEWLLPEGSNVEVEHAKVDFPEPAAGGEVRRAPVDPHALTPSRSAARAVMEDE